MIRTDPGVRDGRTQESLKGVAKIKLERAGATTRQVLNAVLLCALVCRPAILQLWHKGLQRRHCCHLELDNFLRGAVSVIVG